MTALFPGTLARILNVMEAFAWPLYEYEESKRFSANLRAGGIDAAMKRSGKQTMTTAYMKRIGIKCHRFHQAGVMDSIIRSWNRSGPSAPNALWMTGTLHHAMK
eukprot:scaffold153864_cov31-Tisochrysis_lutea.AAC.2